MTTPKRGPKAQTLIMVPLEELVSALPVGAKIKISRVWWQEMQETLGLTPAEVPEVLSAPQNSQKPESGETIVVETLTFHE
jgi:hypothetical protein